MTRIETVPERLSSRGLNCGARFFVNDKNRIPHHKDATRCHTEQIRALRVIRGRLFAIIVNRSDPLQMRVPSPCST